MDDLDIKERILALENDEFERFEKWFFKFGCNRVNKNAKKSKLRQEILKLPYKDFDSFWEWFDDLCHERYLEEVKNDPVAQEYLELGRLIMSKTGPDPFLINMLKSKNCDKKK